MSVHEELQEWVKAGLLKPFDAYSMQDEVFAEVLKRVRQIYEHLYGRDATAGVIPDLEWAVGQLFESLDHAPPMSEADQAKILEEWKRFEGIEDAGRLQATV